MGVGGLGVKMLASETKNLALSSMGPGARPLTSTYSRGTELRKMEVALNKSIC